MLKNIFNVTDDTFEQTVLKSDKAVLVDFWAEWCAPCKMIEPIVEELAAECEDNLIVARFDTQSGLRTPAKYRVTAIPTLILFKDGEEAERIVGLRGKHELKSIIDAAI